MSTEPTNPTNSADTRPPFRRRLLIIAIMLVVFGLLAALVRGMARDVLVIPLLYTLWSIQDILSSLPQSLLWGLAIFAALVVAIRSVADVPVLNMTGRRLRDRYGRVESWMRLIGQSRREEYPRWRFAQRIAHLANELVIERERLDVRDARRAVENGIGGMPPEVRAFMRGGLTSFRPRQRGFARLRPASGADPLQLDPVKAVEYLEHYVQGGYGDDQA